MKVTAAVATAPRSPFEIQLLDLEPPRSDEILVRIAAVGLCHTDVSARDQLLPIPLPAVLGHEGAGVVESVGEAVTKVVPGDRVVLTFRSCGRCTRCEVHQPSYCEHSGVLNFAGARPDGSRALRRDGEAISSNFFGQSSFATHALAYERNVVKVAQDAPLDTYAPLGCGIQTGAGAVLRSIACEPGSSLLVTGAGSVGLSAVMAARGIARCGAIMVSDPMPERRALARELGATHVIDPATGKLAHLVRAIMPAGVDYALDTTGQSKVMDAAVFCLRLAGTLGLLGIPAKADAPTPGYANVVLARGLRIQGILEGDSDPDVFIPELIAHHRAGNFPFDRLISRYPFTEINQAIDDQHAGKCTKAVLVME
ncbi:NAD(P)-dependent alcohol dehydrogenase [Phenylobacterium sp. LjRoot225]|uniref:NAD(P)-dependent alcohol dehydrogenase n=1 Tax=Phenylobacterium sp. LjRoot225 TaxID=3342285 RepID=UPI003ECF7921